MAGRNLGEAFVVISPDTSSFLGELIGKVKAAVSGVKAEVKVTADATSLTALQARIAALTASLSKMRADADTTAAQAKIAALQVRAMSLDKTLRGLKADVDSSALLAAEARMLGLEAATEKLGTTAKKTGAAGTPVITGGWWGGQIAGIGAWHIILDGVIEGLIVLVGASAAAAAGIAAMSESAYDVGVRLHSVQVVSGALGQDIPPLTGKFDALMTAMAPRTIEAFGGGLNLINSQAGGLLKTMEPVVNLFDTWIAKIDLYAASQKNLSGIVTAGTGYLEQLGHIIGILAQALSDLLTKEPGIATFLLYLIGFAAGALRAFAALPGPIVALTLGLHGLYLWSRVLVIGPIVAFAKAIGLLSAESAGAVLRNATKFSTILRNSWRTTRWDGWPTRRSPSGSWRTNPARPATTPRNCSTP